MHRTINFLNFLKNCLGDSDHSWWKWTFFGHISDYILELLTVYYNILYVGCISLISLSCVNGRFEVNKKQLSLCTSKVHRLHKKLKQKFTVSLLSSSIRNCIKHQKAPWNRGCACCSLSHK